MRNEHIWSKTSPKLKTPGAKMSGKKAEIHGKAVEIHGKVVEIPGKKAEVPGTTAEISWHKAGFKNSALEGLQQKLQLLL